MGHALRGDRRPDLTTDPRFETAAQRRQHAGELYEEIADWTRQRTKYEAMHALAPEVVPCTAVLSTRDLWEDPHLRERGLIQKVEHTEHGTIELMRSPARMSASEVELQAAPLLGQHTDDVLGGELGLTGAEIGELRAEGVIG